LPPLAGEVFFQFMFVSRQSPVGVLEAYGSGLGAQVAWVWTYGLLSGESGVELQGDQSRLRGGQEQGAYRGSKCRGIKGFHGMKLSGRCLGTKLAGAPTRYHVGCWP
jgi:hypothetical protein